MRVIFNPYDVLFFKDSRPFNAGEAHLARTQQFVPPMTVTGAIRAALYNVAQRYYPPQNEEAKIKYEEYMNLVNFKKEEPNFKVKGVFWYGEFNGGEELFPLPRDVVKVRGNNGEALTVLGVHEEIHGYRVATAKGRIHFSEASGYLSKSALIEYLKGDLDGREDVSNLVIPTEDVFEAETRIGIALNGTKTTVEGMLYRTENLRPKDHIKVTAWVEDDERLKEGLKKANAIRLGGEGHFAFIDVDDAKPWEEFEALKPSSDCIRLYVATPLIIEHNGGYTWDIRHELSRKGVKAEIVKAFLSKPLRVEGWDLANGRPKKPRFAVPAGSVYYIRVTEGLDNIEPVRNLGELTNLGYGLVFAGTVDCEKGDG